MRGSKDPYVTTPQRAPLADEVEIAILGAGYGGLCAGARLVQEGVNAKEIRIFDKGGDDHLAVKPLAHPKTCVVSYTKE